MLKWKQSDPIASFEKHFVENADQYIKDLIERLMTLNQVDWQQLQKLDEVITKLEQEVANQEQIQKIAKAKRCYFWTRWLAFNQKVKTLKAKLMAWKNYCQEQNKIIETNRNQLKAQLKKTINNQNLHQLFALAFLNPQVANGNAISTFLTNYDANYLDLISGINYNLDGLKFTNLVYRQLVMEKREYYGTKTVRYYDHQSQRWRNETLFATYQHPQPIIKTKVLSVSDFKINFDDQNVNLVLRAKQKIKSHWKQNRQQDFIISDFDKYYEIERYESQSEYALQLSKQWTTSWIDLLAQEQLLKLINQHPDLVGFSLEKSKQHLILKNATEDYEEPVSLDFKTYQGFKTSLNDALVNYYQNYFKVNQVYTLISFFYRYSNYLTDTKQSEQQIDIKHLFYQHLNDDQLPPLYHYRFKKLDFDCLEYQKFLVIATNYQIEKRVKYVPVRGVHVGTKRVPVYYDHYQPLLENKFLYFKNLEQQDLGGLIIYCDQKQFLVNNFSNWQNQTMLKQFVEQYQNLLKEYQVVSSLVIDQFGLSIMIDSQNQNFQAAIAFLIKQLI